MNLCRLVLDSFESEDILEPKGFLQQVRTIISDYPLLLQYLQRFELQMDTATYSDFISTHFKELPNLKLVSPLQRSIIEGHLRKSNP